MGTKVQITVSDPEAAMLGKLAVLSGHNLSLLAARAITGWLQHNYRDQIDLYSQEPTEEEPTDG